MPDLLGVCVRCGKCVTVCPVADIDRLESSTARGKIALLTAYRDGRLENPAKLKTILDRCLMCGRCEMACPNGVETVRIFAGAKTDILAVAPNGPA